ncbi:enoyl-CoA hydratase/isomerase family protein [Actinomadura harenae]|uniref:enoyl-CoA hydratase/isomerase family protein n=1 Tax=Actinomadura harenae TaxID=2483351 RepID=UPI001F240234|nr:enoyl-CoA hydratase-related protein [Actinomadura harenae]
MDGVTLKRDKQNEHVAEIVLDRPEALNALSTAMARRLAAVCAEVAADGSVRAVVLSASGDKAFCVGADLKERNAMTDDEILAQRPVFRAAFGGVLNLPQPVIAAVHGYALGGGCEFALSCDMIVADETAVFGLPEVTVGLVPGGGGTQLAMRKIGSGRAADLVLTGRRLTADEAAGLGLADRRVAKGEARTEALSIASRIAKNSPIAVRAAKRAMRIGGDLPLEAGLDVEENAWRTVAFSPDRREGIAAFAEKRTPDWSAPA